VIQAIQQTGIYFSEISHLLHGTLKRFHNRPNIAPVGGIESRALFKKYLLCTARLKSAQGGKRLPYCRIAVFAGAVRVFRAIIIASASRTTMSLRGTPTACTVLTYQRVAKVCATGDIIGNGAEENFVFPLRFRRFYPSHVRHAVS